ncbi:hypothetical protein ACOME3_003687 [Neoechinorhynchus agilis]
MVYGTMDQRSEQYQQLKNFNEENGSSAVRDWYNQIRATVNSRMNTQAEQSNVWCGLSRSERLIISVLFALGAALLYTMAFVLYIPLLSLNPAKFIIIYSTANCLSVVSFLFLIGTKNARKALIDNNRWVYSLFYVVSFSLTLYFASGVSFSKNIIFHLVTTIQLHNATLTIIFAFVQIVIIVMYAWSMLPSFGGVTNWWYRMFGNRIASQVSSLV